MEEQDTSGRTAPDKRRAFLRRANDRIRAFDDYHYTRGKWISFRRLVEWGKSQKNGRPDYTDLRKAVTGSFFEKDGRSVVLFLSVGALQAGALRFSSKDLVAAARTHNGAPHFDLELDYLSRFWIPRAICERWLKNEGYDLPPWLEEPPAITLQTVTPDQTATVEKTFLAWISLHECQGTKPNRNADLQHMRQAFPKITDHEVRDLRRNLAPAHWKEPGRPTKKI